MVHAQEIAQKVVDKEDENTINALLLNLIRPVIINAFKEEGEQYANAMNTVVDDVSRAMQEALNIEGNFVDDIVSDMRSEIVGAVQIAAEFLRNAGPWGTVIGWILTFFGEKVPDVIKWIFGKSKSNILNEATGKIQQVVIGQITEKLRPVMLEQVKAQQERIRESMRQKVADSISNLQDSMKHSVDQSSAEDIQQKIANMEKAISELTCIKNAC